tara:strand:- start:452 stop:1270 length:819 start_codon:yes stop_codon:yes gene_type:complete
MFTSQLTLISSPDFWRHAMQFYQQSVIVTGATSGIGVAVAKSFAQQGANVLITGRSRERGNAVLDDIKQHGGQARFVVADLRKRSACERVVASAQKHFGGVDVLVNNAGVIHRANVADTTDEQWRDTFAANVDAVFHLSRAVVPLMRAKKKGVIVNVASDASLIGATEMAAYCASKGAVLQLTRAMALDHAREGIRVNAVCPDNVETPMLASEARQLGLAPKTYFKRTARAIPLGRNGQPEDIAAAVVFLASDDSGWITGIGLPIDGGVTAQ